MGGPYDVRGFEMNSIGTKAETCSLGGSFGCAGTLHLYKPLIPKDMVRKKQSYKIYFEFKIPILSYT